MCNLIDKDKISMAETVQDTKPVYEYTRPVVKRVGGEEGALKAVLRLPSCVPHPVTKHRIHHFVYFSQLSAHKKGLGATRLSGHLLAALKPLKQPDKVAPLHPPCLACQKGLVAFLSLPPPPAPYPAYCSCTGSLKIKLRAGLVSYNQQGRLIGSIRGRQRFDSGSGGS